MATEVEMEERRLAGIIDRDQVDRERIEDALSGWIEQARAAVAEDKSGDMADHHIIAYLADRLDEATHRHCGCSGDCVKWRACPQADNCGCGSGQGAR